VSRPLIAVPARFSANASALRHRAVVAAHALVDAIYRAGGEPFVLYPARPDELGQRLSGVDGVVLPGGGDLDPRHYGADPHVSLYDVDADQDAFDLALARFALDRTLPTLAVCRGTQVVNVLLGGTLRQDMAPAHRPLVHEVTAIEPCSIIARLPQRTVSCHHHQCVDRLGDGLVVTARAADGTVEAVERLSGGWFLGVQWHPEDGPEGDVVFSALVSAARRLPVQRRTYPTPAGAHRASGPPPGGSRRR
jgi:putative glutamine amidotransferase